MSVDPGLLDGAVAPAENTRLFGHEQAASFLAETYATGHMHHALLLEGPPGIGKATLAFRFARHVLNHPEPRTAPAEIADPPENDAVTRQLASGASHNLLHLTRPYDAKTGRVRTAITVDEVRRAGHFLSQTSGTGNWRIVLIDPADDMNRSAANAILKILEEPPARSLFLVVSHAPGKLLPTIRSRCMPLRLAPLSDDDVRRGLSHLGLDAGQDAQTLDRAVRLADGSLANAVLLLRYGGLDIAEAAEQILSDGPVSTKKAIHALADTLTAKDREIAFAFFSDYMLERVVQAAQRAAETGDLAAAEEWAALSSRLREELATAQIYNLDRKQTVIGLFSAVFQVGAP